jgi:lysophospholipase L1-like esterase
MIRSRPLAIVAAAVGVLASTVLLAGCAQATTTTLSASPTTAMPGQSISLTARVTAATTPTGRVTFRDGAVTIGSAGLSGGTATLTTTTLSAGTHQISASYAAEGVWGASTAAAVTVTVQTATTRYHLALGDSLAAGVGAPAGQGYVDDILAHEQTRLTGLQGHNISCSGATTASMLSGGGCSYTEGSQVAAAAAFLQAHPGHVAYVTIDIGANDITGCLVGGVINLACAQTQMGVVQTNLTAILSRLRAASATVPIVGMTYYDPYLAYWVAGNQTAAQQSQQVAATGNALMANVYATAQAQVADVQGTFDSANYALTGSYNGQAVPQNVSNICAWTRMCSNADIHANATGHQLIAATFQPLIDATVTS